MPPARSALARNPAMNASPAPSVSTIAALGNTGGTDMSRPCQRVEAPAAPRVAIALRVPVRRIAANNCRTSSSLILAPTETKLSLYVTIIYVAPSDGVGPHSLDPNQRKAAYRSCFQRALSMVQ